MNIYSTVDNRNLDKIICMFNSVYENCSDTTELKFFIITDKISVDLPYIPNYLKNILEIKELILDDNWKKLLKEFNNNFYKNSDWCKNDMNFARFLFFEMFPEVDRVLYLDWDMLVLADVFEIKKEYDDSDNMIVADCGKTTFSSNIFNEIFRKSVTYEEIYFKRFNRKFNKISLQIFDFLKLNVKDIEKLEGFNAGLYIVSKEHFERKYLTDLIEKLIKIQKKFKCFNFGTQVVMNFMHVNNRVLIPKIWNHLPSVPNLLTLKIIHFNGVKKPWKDEESKNELWLSYFKKLYPEWEYPYKEKNINTNIIKNKKKNNLKLNKKIINYLR